MAQYNVNLVLELNDGHPRKWVAEAISENLNDGEDILSIDFADVSDIVVANGGRKLYGLCDNTDGLNEWAMPDSILVDTSVYDDIINDARRFLSVSNADYIGFYNVERVGQLLDKNDTDFNDLNFCTARIEVYRDGATVYWANDGGLEIWYSIV